METPECTESDAPPMATIGTGPCEIDTWHRGGWWSALPRSVSEQILSSHKRTQLITISAKKMNRVKRFHLVGMQWHVNKWHLSTLSMTTSPRWQPASARVANAPSPDSSSRSRFVGKQLRRRLRPKLDSWDSSLIDWCFLKPHLRLTGFGRRCKDGTAAQVVCIDLWQKNLLSNVIAHKDTSVVLSHCPSSEFMWVCLKMLCTPLYPMVLLIIIPMKNG